MDVVDAMAKVKKGATGRQKEVKIESAKVIR